MNYSVYAVVLIKGNGHISCNKYTETERLDWKGNYVHSKLLVIQWQITIQQMVLLQIYLLGVGERL